MRLLGALTVAALIGTSIGLANAAPPRPAVLTVASNTFRAQMIVPDRMTCNGRNISPELHWSSAPKRTRSYAVTAWDPDAPARGGWWHWVLFDISSGTHRIAEGQGAGTSGTTSSNSTGYSGPCPPSGAAHHYRFTVYALDVNHIGADPKTTGPQLLGKMKGHVLAQGVVIGLYKR